MRAFILKLLPPSLEAALRKIRTQYMYRKFKDKPIGEVFETIYHSQHWNNEDDKESVSGTGSSLKQTKVVIYELPKLFKSYQVKSMLDVPCGDFNWMKMVDLSGIQYYGADIVAELVKSNNEMYSNEKVKFLTLDLTKDALPQVDIILVRDCFIHFSYKDMRLALKNIKQSKIKFLLTTTYTDNNRMDNYDIITGNARAINLEKKPFNFSKPLSLINEQTQEKGGRFKDKNLGLWEVSKIEINF